MDVEGYASVGPRERPVLNQSVLACSVSFSPPVFGVLLLFRILYVGAGRLSVYDDEAPALDSYLQRSEPAYAGAGQGAAGGLLAPGVSTMVHEDASVT